MIQGDANHGTSKDTDPGRDRAIVIVYLGLQIAHNRLMVLLTHWAGLWIGEVAGLHWSDVTTTEG
jgi:hypothetical protein